jgi:hypothetical protein
LAGGESVAIFAAIFVGGRIAAVAVVLVFDVVIALDSRDGRRGLGRG